MLTPSLREASVPNPPNPPQLTFPSPSVPPPLESTHTHPEHQPSPWTCTPVSSLNAPNCLPRVLVGALRSGCHDVPEVTQPASGTPVAGTKKSPCPCHLALLYPQLWRCPRGFHAPVAPSVPALLSGLCRAPPGPPPPPGAPAAEVS